MASVVPPTVFLPTPDAGRDTGTCASALNATIRDFTPTHPDFEHYLGTGIQLGIVAPDLGADQKPVYGPAAETSSTTGPREFDQWYRDVPGVNQAIPVTIVLTDDGAGSYIYDSPSFFPVDGRGFGNGPADVLMAVLGQQPVHNFLFTTEIHSSFTYEGGEVFAFRGDDDLWVFVNGRLALDLGGVHAPDEGTIQFDASAAALGLRPGETYPMDIFHAERHTGESNFRIETSISCFRPVVIR